MSDYYGQMGQLSKQVSDLETQLGEVAGNLAELISVMAPFLARYQDSILRYYDELIQTQREIADLRAARGDRSAILAGQARSPLDDFLSQNVPVDEQYARVWQGKKAPRIEGPQNLPPVTLDLKQLYAKVVARLHPDLADTRAERDRLRSLMSKANEAYVRRDMISMQAMADVYCTHTNLPAIVDDKVVRYQEARIQRLEVVIGKIEGQYFDLRYGLPAKIKANAELTWAEEKRDLIGELSSELRRQLQEAQSELITLKSRP
jgi:hypothetical protein